MGEPVDTTCPEPCGAMFKAVLPEVEANNTRNYSTAIAVHEKPIQCPACGRWLVPLFAAVQIGWMLKAIPSEGAQEPSKLILPGHARGVR